MLTKRPVTVNVMAPLLVGDPQDMDSDASLYAWDAFGRHLKKSKDLGVEAVTTDVWWALIEPLEGQFNWAYYDRLSDYIIDHKLFWIPIESFHQCGGNVGDDVFVPLREWVWAKAIQELRAKGWLPGPITARDVRFVSEQGNECEEFVSFYATTLMLETYGNVMRAFRDKYRPKAKHIPEINISLGPAGEMRYPSYNAHDHDTDYPTRGALQCYSRLALRAFRLEMLKKYGTEAGIDKAWGTSIATGQSLNPPTNPTEFFGSGHHRSIQYGRDLFDWYASVPMEHADQMLRLALSIYGAEDSGFKGVDIGAKVPGIHWRTGTMKKAENPKDKPEVVLGDRLAELAAGLIRTSGEWNEKDARGYKPLLQFFKGLQGKSNRVVLHFTCLEMDDGEGAERNANSLARSLVRWVGTEAKSAEVPIKGENAVSWNLPKPEAWDLMKTHMALPGTEGLYSGLTILRMGDVVDDPEDRTKVAYEQMGKLIKAINAGQPASDAPPSGASQAGEAPKAEATTAPAQTAAAPVIECAAKPAA